MNKYDIQDVIQPSISFSLDIFIFKLPSLTPLIIHVQRTRDHEEICVPNPFRSISTNDVRMCYTNNNRNHSILISFTIDQDLFDIFHSYRYILRSIDETSLSTMDIHLLTNFTELIDLSNHLRVLNLATGQYEICLDFQSNYSSYIYSPRNGCIPIRIGQSLHRSFKQSSTQLLLALTAGIVLFLILGLVVQSLKTKKLRKQQSSSVDHQDDQARRSSLLSTTSLQKMRRFLRHSNPSKMQQWARHRAFRHRISTADQEINPPTADIYQIPINEYPRDVSFFLNPTEEFELL